MTKRIVVIAVVLWAMMHSLYAQNNDYVAYINKYKDISLRLRT